MAHDIIELNISDTSVPIETKVIPIIKLDTPRLDARAAECFTAILLQKKTRIILPMSIVKPINIPKIVICPPIFHLGIKSIDRDKDCRKLGDSFNFLVK